MNTNEFHAKVKELKELRSMIDELTAEAQTIEDEIKSAMIESGTEEITAGIYKVRYAKVKSKRFDSKGFKEQCGTLYDRFIKETETRRFTIV